MVQQWAGLTPSPATFFGGGRAVEHLLNAHQVAQILNVHLLSVYRFVYRGQLKSVRVGGVVRFRPSDVESFIHDRPASKGTAA